ncbi:cytochrome c oxidase copper chaperone [Takifugu rubripes]|uniref:Cytochrome c oxidase copper chaperone n=1 Tax=Takifugu flavidus TaxID=433684 RepID=A0A5C6PNJ3_9TELE|nr:cytochrome c oxidase copper chaperone [Takifugu rubripes]XP_056910919.1 cytochrome c oxidase copper chaperone [Takifugu flavidus]TWW80421.1 Cytochrome c oxidase copper chaperone [Takifugu flavidus]
MLWIHFEGEASSAVCCHSASIWKMSTVCAANVDSPAATLDVPEQKKPLKPCCACPETKKVRDACIIEKGEEKCSDLIEAHKECMRALGFKI